MLRAEFRMERDALEFFQPVFQLHLQIGFPEEFGIRQPRPHHAFIATDNGGTIIARNHVRGEQKFVRELRLARFAQHKAFLVCADRGADHFRRNIEKPLFKRPHQYHRPFDKPCDFLEQTIIFHKLQPLRESEVARIIGDDFLAAIRRKHNLGLFERRHIIIKPPDMDRCGCEKAMAIGEIARMQPVDVEMDDFRRLRLRAERAEDRMQRTHPAQRTRFCRSLAPAHRFRPWEGADDTRHNVGNYRRRLPPLALDNGYIEIALFRIGLDRGL